VQSPFLKPQSHQKKKKNAYRLAPGLIPNTEKKKKKDEYRPGAVAHTSNSSYSGGRDMARSWFKANPRENVFETPISINKSCTLS
jgi:hypothetical protein